MTDVRLDNIRTWPVPVMLTLGVGLMLIGRALRVVAPVVAAKAGGAMVEFGDA